ncbi:hypothetical protein GS399_11890 [Pedobacter sp. HMF7647]|uniref:Fido domain-containing protein n=1 Tax=Hufsiella arboris TaxID=2695275 RepID=A0A7K1YAR2_9SPHI|nr:Fic family protein [Hufsiella arboris]MXV51675.1 hypothetical protein [Hufsiella arboris]
MNLSILPSDIFNEYNKIATEDHLKNYELLEDSELSIDTFSFYTSVAAVFSSKIEGEPIELDSYVKHKRFGIEFLPDYTRKIDDLYNAYQFANNNSLTESNILNAHQLLTKHILPKSHQGKIRTGNMFATTADGKIEYVAAQAGSVNNELKKFYQDLNTLSTKQLTIQEIFFFASLLHLVFVKIHPFDDGNGRISRLIEKWFLSEKLGDKAWLIESEKNYYDNHKTYYKNIRLLGLEYESLDYSQALPFLLMLPDSVKHH